MRSRKRKLILWLILGGLAMVSAEVVLLLLALVFPSVDAVIEGRAPVPRVIEDPELGFTGNPRFPEHDRNGFRNPSVPRRAEVLALGDSQTYGSGVAPGEAWPRQLAETGGVTTYAMAFGGFGPAHSLLLLEEALALEPRVVVYGLYSGNDLWDAYSLVYLEGRLEDYRSSDAALLEAIEEAKRREPLDQVREEAKISSEGIRAVLEVSRLYRLLRTAKNRFADLLKGPERWEDIREHYASYPDQCDVFESGELHTVFKPRYRLFALDLEDPRIREGRRITLEAILAIRQRAEETGARFLVLCIPTKELAFSEAVSRSSWAPSEGYERLIRMERRFWDGIRTDLNEEGVAHVDALERMRALLRAGRQPYDMTTNGHPNALGQRALAELVREGIERLELGAGETPATAAR